MVAMGTVGTLVAVRSVRTHVWRHAALQLAVAVSIWCTEVRSDVARHLVRWTRLVPAASTELAETAVLCCLELLVDGVKEAAEWSWEGVALLWRRARRSIRRAVRVFARTVVWVRWRRWAERHREVVHHVLVGWLNRQDEELAVLVSEQLNGDFVNSHRLVVKAQNLEFHRDDLVTVG